MALKTVIKNAAPFLKRTIKGMANQDVFFDHCFMIADLGCSSGMNTLLVASSIIDTIHELFQVLSMVDYSQTKVCTLFTPLVVFIGFLSDDGQKLCAAMMKSGSDTIVTGNGWLDCRRSSSLTNWYQSLKDFRSGVVSQLRKVSQSVLD
ncbi:hypothetical protein L1987_04765 [Smallanthus sonchifolius]|uniref:Uncharacterized protein n=1 Tax=Smallanthus sonchifolius TaxID=185202 RepID=A0ACB9JTP2_9ASTR|nr:hypothetical protein L1987_04765 [Smallanthus sonchifolius]